MSNQIPDKIVLWHGSLATNKDAILKNGIKYLEVTDSVIGKKIEKAHEEIAEVVKLENFSNNHHVTERMQEAKERGGIVYLSAEKEYAISNSLAGQEWKDFLCDNALDEKFKKEKMNVGKLQRRVLNLRKKLEQKEDKLLKSEVPDEQYRKLRDERNGLANEYYKWDKIASDHSSKLHKAMDDYKEQILTKEAVLFKVELPWEEFKRLATDKEREYIEQFEERVRSGFYTGYLKKYGFDEDLDRVVKGAFGEVHLKEVPSRYIQEVGEFVKPKHYAIEGRGKLEVPMQKIPKAVSYV